jgi:SAM-dependent methyltransferase
VLGCNEGWVVERLCSTGFSGTILASDIANKALARAQARIAALGFNNVEYIVADLNSYRFDGLFDFIVAEGVLHHIGNIEYCLEGLHSALAPDGVIVMVEFEGPFRFQLPAEQVRWINAALSVLPKGLRPVFDNEPLLPPTASDLARVYYAPASAKAVERFDPSEAICGHKLRGLIPRFFNVLERKPFGGTLLSYMTGHFPFERANTNSEVEAWLRVLIEIEDAVLRSGSLEDEFVFYVVGRKGDSNRAAFDAKN